MAYKIRVYTESGSRYTAVVEEKETADLFFNALTMSGVYEYITLSEVEEKENLVREWAEDD